MSGYGSANHTTNIQHVNIQHVNFLAGEPPCESYHKNNCHRNVAATQWVKHNVKTQCTGVGTRSYVRLVLCKQTVLHGKMCSEVGADLPLHPGCQKQLEPLLCYCPRPLSSPLGTDETHLCLRISPFLRKGTHCGWPLHLTIARYCNVSTAAVRFLVALCWLHNMHDSGSIILQVDCRTQLGTLHMYIAAGTPNTNQMGRAARRN